MRPDSVGLGGFDSHAFPPARRVRALLATVCLLHLACLPLASAHAQRVVPSPPISPARAFLASALLPGLGQARLDRSTGVFFALVEAVGVTMYAKSKNDLDIARASRDSTPLSYTIDAATGLPARDSTGALQVATWQQSRFTRERINARRTHVEDWVAVIIFNHLFAGIDAFVAAQLWDLPAQVEFRAAPKSARVTARFRW